MKPAPLTSRRTAEGVTLVELLVALAVLGIVLVAASTSFGDMTNTNRLKAAAETLHAYLQFARSESIKQGRDLFVRVKPGDDSLSETWCLGLANSSGCDCAAAGSCVFGPAGLQIERTVSSSDFVGISLQSNQANIGFDNRRGANGNPGTIDIVGPDENLISVVHSRRGRVRLCSDSIAGYPCN